ncbi:hypothetical protein VN97_g8393 [Penicillium thymicola]|uniref:Uncharacterized protein n=1 Tax=Penicillium thymicola TaxID=293382 RepID=A0AAI9TEK0_PENTH|nr:hypothetical protein VN97_g8393 [Penicillium thymicola]
MLFAYKALGFDIRCVYIPPKNDTSALFMKFTSLSTWKILSNSVAYLLRILNTKDNKSLQTTGFKVVYFCLRPQHPVYQVSSFISRGLPN